MKIIIFEIKGSFLFQSGFYTCFEERTRKKQFIFAFGILCFYGKLFPSIQISSNSCFTASLTLLLHSTHICGSHDPRGSVKSLTPKSPTAHCNSHFCLLGLANRAFEAATNPSKGQGRGHVPIILTLAHSPRKWCLILYWTSLVPFSSQGAPSRKMYMNNREQLAHKLQQLKTTKSLHLWNHQVGIKKLLQYFCQPFLCS